MRRDKASRESCSLWQRRSAWVALTAIATLGMPRMAVSADAPASVQEYVRQFEERYRDVRTLEAEFVQTSYALGRTREESGSVYLARGGRMRWVYQKPEEELYVSDGKQIFFYVPAEKQLTISSVRGNGEAQMPLDLLVSHMQLSKVFSRVEFADQALDHVEPGDRVIRGYPRLLYRRSYRSILVELTPSFDVRRLVVFFSDNSTMQFSFNNIKRNQPIDASLFAFSPPPGTEVIQQ